MSPSCEQSIFLAALELTCGSSREAFLAAACGDNLALRAEIQELLNAHERPDHVLDQGAFLSPSLVSIIEERPGTMIGSYRLMELIGEGGFGLVFVAEQQHPVRRKVALKLIKPGMDTREVIARFEAERQALAMMDHPNIARVYEAGTSTTGRPYFVMELVRGVPITLFADQNRSTLRERLELFVATCLAVQHAHQKGIIHRDLKPSNVLVTLHDGSPVVKVIDFGIAKAIGQQLTDKTIYTRFAQMIGTPLYMSPEQAEMSGLDVDTRSDIFSLGVLLYELLTGTTPLDRGRMRQATFEEIRRILREEDPLPPSTRLSTLGAALTTVSAQRGTEPRTLPALVRGDLDWIVMKALEKDRSRRYDTAGAFAADVRRFLNEEPIEARPPSRLYRFQKFARRNKVALTTGSIVAAALVLGTAVSTWQAIRARTAQVEADASRQKAEDFVAHLKAANVLLDSARGHAEQERWGRAYENYTRAAQLQPDHYLVWSGRGSLYLRLGLWRRAAADYQRAMQLGASANNPGWWGIPQLFHWVGDETSYREACTQLLEQQAQTKDSFLTSVVIRSCSIGKQSVTDATTLARKAEELLARAPDHPGGPRFFGDRPPPFPLEFPRDGVRRPPPGGPGWPPRAPVLYLAGLAHYRAGAYDLAIGRLRECVTDKSGWPVQPLGHAVLAMAYHRTGKHALAREMLCQTDRGIAVWTDSAIQGRVGALPVPWFDWLESLSLRREACDLLTGAPPLDDPRWKALRRRALAAIDSEE